MRQWIPHSLFIFNQPSSILRILPKSVSLLWKARAKLRAKTLPPRQGGDRVLMLGTGGLKTSLLRWIVDFRESGIFQLLPKPVSNRATSYNSEKSVSGRETLAGLSPESED